MSRTRKNKAEYKAEDFKGQATELSNLQDAAPLAVAAGPEGLPIDDRPAETPVVNEQVAPMNIGNAIQDATAPNPDATASPLAGLNQGRFEQAPDANMILQEMYRILPSKEIAALLNNQGG